MNMVIKLRKIPLTHQGCMWILPNTDLGIKGYLLGMTFKFGKAKNYAVPQFHPNL